ncbi:permease prefix domain 1-containing protein [Paractinoplanes brasiliensis]|uniref:Uncharacterized protein n=1 Tax=Paractinoplanes brasiliensis TaxID=52695 RepID=A0A4R6JYA7_9ACTN|nr:permease prefix domain 1-containing protein [Actinoplanes brasiliensis]TDO41719.1 hypothetical protein C8E87_5458 [Actinoplanes brasiliensis]GID33366.1 hypothetical protein Abr02nite_83490 [Actinoplanes brasiliensis]
MTANLVDRYVLTALRRLPEQQRADIDRELRASIEDAVDARVEAGEPRDTAIEQTLLELGDPDRLADSYAGRPNYLIGPELYPVWRRSLTALLTLVLPIVVLVTAFVQVLADDAGFGEVIGTAVGTIINVGAHMAFWVTLTFWIVERTGAGKSDLNRQWTPQDLPRYEPGALTRVQFAANLLWPAVVIGALVLQQFTFTEEPLLDPANWSFWWPVLIALIVLKGLWVFWVYRLGRWTRPVAVVNAVLSLVTGGVIIYLLSSDNFFNPAFTGFNGTDVDLQGWISVVVMLTTGVSIAYDIVDVFRKAEQARKGLGVKVPGTGNPYTAG